MSTTDSANPETFPPPVWQYFAAMNAFDSDALVALFPEDGLVNDIRREFWGPASIRRWVEREITGDKVVATRYTEVKEHYGDVIVSAVVDGEYDKTGVPDPLVLTFYFTLRGEKIARLIIIGNNPGY
ncbi:nuclear transport factor 2 family protein [Streptomyces sp. NPDC005708]|uniref:nuclear transport factor 2 family protein n=1 Tax=Streptomyces sp. NPDC005708 TaxID=3154564 RepID=UPI0033C165FC